ncbi:Bax inhibitor-1/YccA family protein [Streptomyces sp. NPDC006660]|uniref:Bax inhibitor-1/YccA family protein n=1 Tax=Streptomyces sp. NPDC006660 TaxID=3156901 RepID=UPI0033FC045E
MRSSNPVFSRRGFSRDTGYAGFNTAQQPQAGGNPYAQAPANPYATNPYAQQDTQFGAPPAAAGNVMTMDDVVTRTAISLGLVVVGAVLAWVMLPVDADNIRKSMGVAVAAGLVSLVLGLIQAFKRKPVPALILGYAATQGVALGVISSIISTYVAAGAVPQAVLGTMAVFGGVLIAYKTGLIRVNRRFQGFVAAAAIGFVLLMITNSLFAVFGGGDGLGFRSGGLGILFGIIGVILGACFLALDFKQVEDGIAYGAPREESWLAAFGLTLTLVWIYREMLNIIAIIQGD